MTYEKGAPRTDWAPASSHSDTLLLVGDLTISQDGVSGIC